MTSKSKILVVDDSKTFTSYISSLIGGEEGLEIFTMNDSTKALDKALEWIPDVLLTDFEMPQIKGTQLCRLFRQNETLNSTSLIMLTGKEGDEMLIRAIENGADDYISKSSSKEVILIKVRSMIRKSKMTKEVVKKKQLEAIHMLIVTANHKLNNYLMISNALVAKALRHRIDPLEALEKITDTNSDIQNVLKKLKTIEHINEDNYIDDIKMIKFD